MQGTASADHTPIGMVISQLPIGSTLSRADQAGDMRFGERSGPVPPHRVGRPTNSGIGGDLNQNGSWACADIGRHVHPTRAECFLDQATWSTRFKRISESGQQSGARALKKLKHLFCRGLLGGSPVPAQALRAAVLANAAREARRCGLSLMSESRLDPHRAGCSRLFPS